MSYLPSSFAIMMPRVAADSKDPDRAAKKEPETLLVAFPKKIGQAAPSSWQAESTGVNPLQTDVLKEDHRIRKQHPCCLTAWMSLLRSSSEQIRTEAANKRLNASIAT